MKWWPMARRCGLNSAGYMTLRTVALFGGLILLVAMLIGGGWSAENWPGLVIVAGICVALAVERRHYGRALKDKPGPGWVETEEQFVDDASGKLVRVWYHPQTGERRYIEVF
jgi:hypothetical protein